MLLCSHPDWRLEITYPIPGWILSDWSRGRGLGGTTFVCSLHHMDFDQCLQILLQRQAASNSDCCCSATLSADQAEVSTESDSLDLSQESNLKLINIFLMMQEERVKV